MVTAVANRSSSLSHREPDPLGRAQRRGPARRAARAPARRRLRAARHRGLVGHHGAGGVPGRPAQPALLLRELRRPRRAASSPSTTAWSPSSAREVLAAIGGGRPTTPAPRAGPPSSRIVRFVDEDRRRARVLYVEALGNEALNRRRIETGHQLVSRGRAGGRRAPRAARRPASRSAASARRSSWAAPASWWWRGSRAAST